MGDRIFQEGPTYRIFQEALTNVVRHAGPTRAHLTLGYRPHEVSIEIWDDGPDPRRPPDPGLSRQGTGHGLIGIRERTALFGGTASAGPAGNGYRVRATLRTSDFAAEPAAQEPPADAPPAQEPPTHDHPGQEPSR